MDYGDLKSCLCMWSYLTNKVLSDFRGGTNGFSRMKLRYRRLDTRLPYLTPAVGSAMFMLSLIFDLEIEPESASEFVNVSGENR